MSGMSRSVRIALVVASALILRRPESASLFVEDRFGYLIVRIMAALIFAVVGLLGFLQSLGFLFAA